MVLPISAFSCDPGSFISPNLSKKKGTKKTEQCSNDDHVQNPQSYANLIALYFKRGEELIATVGLYNSSHVKARISTSNCGMIFDIANVYCEILTTAILELKE